MRTTSSGSRIQSIYFLFKSISPRRRYDLIVEIVHSDNIQTRSMLNGPFTKALAPSLPSRSAQASLEYSSQLLILALWLHELSLLLVRAHLLQL